MRRIQEIEIELPQIVLGQMQPMHRSDNRRRRRVLRAGESEAFPGQQASCWR